jgi:predicted Zn finger-like uncharacterized protein
MGKEIVVKCEKCASRYTLDPDLIKGEAARVRCSRCSHVFSVKKPVEQVVPDDIMDFEEPDLGLEVERPVAPEPPPPRVRPRPPKRPLVGYAIIFIIAAAAVFGGLYYFKGRSPGFKPSPGDKGTDLLNLLGMSAHFVTNRDAGTLLLVSGKLRNEYPVARRRIRLRLRIYTEDSKVAQEKLFYAGGSLSRDEAGKLNIKQIKKRTEAAGKGPQGVVMPAQMIPFAVVMDSLPRLAKLGDYSLELVSSSP